LGGDANGKAAEAIEGSRNDSHAGIDCIASDWQSRSQNASKWYGLMTALQLRPRLGVIGGIGPLASADFYRKVIELTPASCDADHIPQVILSLPQIPDRSKAILDQTDAPLAALMTAVETLNSLGVELIAMACNTVHHWYDRLAATSRAEILHIAGCSIEALRETGCGKEIVVMATRGTLASGFYEQRLRAAGYTIGNPSAVGFQQAVDDAARLVKAGAVAQAREAMSRAMEHCMLAKPSGVIFACTELPIAAEGMMPKTLVAIDSNLELARACVRRLTGIGRTSSADDRGAKADG
jgi:aspartate racemase